MPSSNNSNILENTEDLHPVLAEFLADVDPRLLDAGWGFEAAKSVEYGLTDQSMVNHVRNGVFALFELNDIAPAFDAYELDDEELRQTVALFVAHDLHKLRGETDRHDEYDIDRAEVEELVTELGLDEFAPSLHVDDFHACAVDHENSWNANPEHATRRYNRLRPFVRIADAFASCSTPEDAASERNENALANAYPQADLELRHHTLDDVKGVLTNVLNSVVGEVLAERAGYERLLLYQDGCVYLADGDTPAVDVDEDLVEDVYERLQSNLGDAHPAFESKQELAKNLSTRSQGFYGINDQDFFYAGVGNVFLAVATKAAQDADPDDDPTESMKGSMEALDERLPIDIDTTTRVAPGYARLVYTVKRSFVDPLVDGGYLEDDALTATCEVFGVDDDVIVDLQEIRDGDELSLTAGGKWDYSYAIGQHVADLARENDWNEDHLTEFALTRLESMTDEWDDAVMAAHTGEFETELQAYIADVLRVGGQASSPTAEMKSLSDPFEEHHGARRGKTCTFCNRGTTSTRKSDMKASKSLTTFQAGYSNRIPPGEGEPEKLLVCLPCQVEFSLRETGSSNRYADRDRLFVHLVPDYFYTPTMWSLYSKEVFGRFTGEAMTRLGRLASAVFDATAQPEDPVGDDEDRRFPADALTTVLREATRADADGGRSMVERLSHDFEPDAQFGTQTLSFYKPQDNETEFQFFGVFLGLAVAASMGTRVYISQSPVPDIRGRDFDEMAKLDAGFTSVSEFYGRDIPLSKLRERLGAAAALVQLGYELERDDARFAKYLRATRNKPLPGSYLLKRAVQGSDDGAARRYLLEEADYLDRHANATDDETPSSEVQQ